MKMTDEEFEEIMKNIELRRPYVQKYYEIFNHKPQWIKGDNFDNDQPNFEDWLISEIRDEKIDEILKKNMKNG